MKLPGEDQLREELKKTGLTWEIVPGGRGRQIRMCGHLVGVIPNSTKKDDKRAFLNVRAQIRRAAKELARETV